MSTQKTRKPGQPPPRKEIKSDRRESDRRESNMDPKLYLVVPRRFDPKLPPDNPQWKKVGFFKTEAECRRYMHLAKKSGLLSEPSCYPVPAYGELERLLAPGPGTPKGGC